ncbi:MAG: peptide-methionine (S)-S-oxide reductase [Candidatus Dadabacteria bacterium]|nr:MAG: peptide-methionine (S)-S-oxide reductase [Candidatus Dadabacteria bacterium]
MILRAIIFIIAFFTASISMANEHKAEAIFAGGCFWCMQKPFDHTPGVIKTIVGYTGGHKDNPTYEEVSSGTTGHVEAIKVIYDPEKVSYSELLNIFWKNIDPLDSGGQFCDRGSQYRSAIFYSNDSEKQAAEKSLRDLISRNNITGEIATEILPAGKFYPAEEYHQSYYKKNPLRYKFYRYSCGRDKRLKELGIK